MKANIAIMVIATTMAQLFAIDAQLIPLGPTIPITLSSNQTLTFIQEYDHLPNRTASYSLQQDTLLANNDDMNKVLLSFDVCFAYEYCSTVSQYENDFIDTFKTNVCQDYCVDSQYNSNIEIINVCNNGIGNNDGSGCINLQLKLTASTISNAQSINQELRTNTIITKSVWRSLLSTIIPNFPMNEYWNTDIVGHYIAADDDVNGNNITLSNNDTWYPVSGGIELCSNDNRTIPDYMTLQPKHYLSTTMVHCCQKHYWWAVRECSDPSNRPCPEGYTFTNDENLGVMSGMYYGEYPNIYYSGW